MAPSRAVNIARFLIRLKLYRPAFQPLPTFHRFYPIRFRGNVPSIQGKIYACVNF